MSQWLPCILTTYKKKVCSLYNTYYQHLRLAFRIYLTWESESEFFNMLEFFNRDCDLKAQQNLCIIQIYVLNAFGPNTSRTSGHESKTVLCFCCDCLLNKLWKGFVKFIMAYSRQINMLNGFEFIWWHYWSIEAMHTLFICKQKKH